MYINGPEVEGSFSAKADMSQPLQESDDNTPLKAPNLHWWSFADR